MEGGRVGTMTGRVFANPDFLGWVEEQEIGHLLVGLEHQKNRIPKSHQNKGKQNKQHTKKGRLGASAGTEFEMHCLKGSSEKK